MRIFTTSSTTVRSITLVAITALTAACSAFQGGSKPTEAAQDPSKTKISDSLTLDDLGEMNPAQGSSSLESGRSSSPQWASFRGGAFNSGTSSTLVRSLNNSTATSRMVAEFDTGGLVWATPVIDESGNVYIGAANKYFYSFTHEGQKRWEYRIDSKADSLIDSAAALIPAIGTQAALVVVPGGDGALHALNRVTGERVWKFEAHGASDSTHQSGVVVNSFEGNVQYSPAHRLIYAGSDNGTMYAVDPSGVEKWSKKTGMMIWTAALISPDQKWMTFGSLDGRLYFLDPATGTELAHPYHGKADIKSSPTTDGQGNIYFGNSNGEITSLKVTPHTGTHKYALHRNWVFKTGREVYSSPAFADGKVLFGSVDGCFYALNALDGTLAWKFDAYSKILSSPVVTGDGVVLFGAKNGKIYALNLAKGDRIWSYRATLDPIKSNLDASIAIDSTGMIHVGSYNGKIYHVPFEYCLTHTNDKERCEFGGQKDSIGFEVPKGQSNLATLVWIPSQTNRTFDSSGSLQMRLVVLENQEFIENAAIDSLPDQLHVEISPSVEFKAQVSSDGKYLNIIPKDFFNPNTNYKIKVSGTYYKQSHNFIWDRLNPANWVGAPFETEQTFKIKPSQGDPWIGLHAESTVTWGLKSLYLLQPEAMDTYTPAALDGQGYLITAFGFDSNLQKMLMLAIPAIPEHDGNENRFILMPEPSKTFVLSGRFQNDNLKGQGSFTLAAMGGEMSLNPMTFSASLDPQTGDLDGQIQASTFCLSIKGNGSKYSFPLSLANQLCDAYGYLHAMGLFKGVRIVEKPTPAKVTRLRSNGHPEIEVDLRLPALTGPHLLSVVQYDPKTFNVAHHSTVVISPQGNTEGHTWTGKMKLKENHCHKKSPYRVALFFDAQQLDLSSADECLESGNHTADGRTEIQQK